jgi:NADPH:quinone reductase
MTTVNRRITLASLPVGFPKVSDFRLVCSPLPSPAAGEVLVRSTYLWLDPCLRGRMSDVGEVMTGGAVGYVVESADPKLRAGDAVEGMLGWQEYAVAPGHELRKVDPGLGPISTALGVLGIPGQTAYFGLVDICEPQRGETVVVSGAAGAVGSLVGQIARIKGCRVVGMADSDADVSWLLDELGFDAALNSKTAADLDGRLGELCPAGVDVYFDNVGGTVTDAVIRRINTGARISVCEQTSQCDLEAVEAGPRWLGQLIVKQAKVQGFLVSSYAPRFREALVHLGRWVKQGRLKYRQDIAQGIEAAPQAFIGMLRGKNQGQQLVQLSEIGAGSDGPP